MSDDLTQRLERCYTGVVHDVMRDMGLTDFVLPPSIRPLFPERTLCGPVFTMRGRVDADADAHTTLLEWTGFLSRAPTGHVVVCQPGDYVIGDRDGVCVIPADRAQAVVSKAERAIATENRIRAAILKGMDPQAAYLEFGIF